MEIHLAAQSSLWSLPALLESADLLIAYIGFILASLIKFNYKVF